MASFQLPGDPPPAAAAAAAPIPGSAAESAPSHDHSSSSPGTAAAAAAAAGTGDDDGLVDDDFLNSGLFNIESSTAFKFLDGLKSKEHVPASRIEELKRKHHSLYQYILTAFEYEKAMIKKTKTLQVEVNKQKMEMDKTGAKVYDDNAEIGELRRELLRCQNEVVLAHDRESRLAKDIEESLITKESLVEDIEEIRRHKTDMLEPQLVANTKEIKMDLMQRKHQAENLEKDLEEKEQILENAIKDKERLLDERETQEAALAKANELPGKIMKQAEVLRDGIASLVIENVKQAQLAAQLDKDIDKVSKKRKEMEEEKAAHSAEFEQRKTEMMEREKECDEIFHEHEMAKEMIAMQEAEKLRQTFALKQAESMIKLSHESLIRCNREKDHLVKAYRKLEGAVNSVVAAVPGARQTNHDAHLALEAAEREVRHYHEAVRNLRKEIEILMHSFLENERHAAGEKELLLARLDANREVEVEIDKHNKRLEYLERAIVQAKHDRELKSRELLRSQVKLRKGKDDEQHCEMEVLDATKKSQESQVQLSEFAALYDKAKNERNRYVNQIASAQQKSMEMREKNRILKSEVDILRNEIAAKDRELTKRRQENSAAYSQRDHAKMEANRLLVQYRDKRSLVDQQTGRIDTLTTSLSSCASDLALLKGRYEQIVAERNGAGVQFLERNDELCMLHEKHNIQERVMGTGELELNQMNEQIRDLGLLRKELLRALTVLKKRIPIVNQFRVDYEALKEQVHEAKAQVLELSKTMETPTDERVRQLEGQDCSQETLDARVKKLEQRLSQQEERLLEKDLVLEEIAHLTERLRAQTHRGREESKEVMSRLNFLSKKISETSKSMMGLIAELSIARTLATALSADVHSKRDLVAKIQARVTVTEQDGELVDAFVDEGIAELDQEWDMLEVRRMQQMARSKASSGSKPAPFTGDWQTLTDEHGALYILPNGSKTRAEPRPNAYVPSLAEALPVARPYGAFAPFKPLDAVSPAAGGNLKYYRNPANKEVIL
ncbi:hypothetical protein BC828DRAFT_388410 [Blastocladiella britannica]|nr:hypothetical protein BC828DRAFT_388410 [Blastocladiella britannica]